MTSLLDVNVLISLLDANHQHHAAAMGWFSQNTDLWASCPITQNGYLRIVTGDGYANTISINKAVRTLLQAVSTPRHEFLPDDISLLNQQIVAHQNVRGPKQLTDVYLLALSVHHGARFVTFDKRVPHVAVRKASSASVHVIRT